MSNSTGHPQINLHLTKGSGLTGADSNLPQQKKKTDIKFAMREKYLNGDWSRYPEAEWGWISVAEYINCLRNSPANAQGQSEQKVCGRIYDIIYREQAVVEIWLAWENEKIQVLLRHDDPTLSSVNDMFSKRSQFPSEILIVGDIVCVRIKTAMSLPENLPENLSAGSPQNLSGHAVFGESHRVEFESPESPATSSVILDVVEVKIAIADEIGMLAPNQGELLSSTAASANETNEIFDFKKSRLWMKYISLVRQFFSDRDFVELRTPTLVPSPGTEVFLEPFTTQFRFGSRSEKLYLPTSPEFHLKRALVEGWSKIFEMHTCFRNGEITPSHQPEFLMLEWYRAFQPLGSIVNDVAALVEFVARGLDIVSGEPWQLRRVTCRELFARLAETVGSKFLLRAETSAFDMIQFAKDLGVDTKSDDSFDIIFHRIMMSKGEPWLETQGPTILSSYPPSQAALARIRSDGFADRFEFYWKRLEIANAFNELNDPEKNRARFVADLKAKSENGMSEIDIDHDLLKAIERGMPPASGIALGVDRLFMALTNTKDIRSTRLYSVFDKY
jgi:elongation factor P--(R)-beta-lysine ligase